MTKICFKAKFQNLNYLSVVNNKLEQIELGDNLPNLEFLLANENSLEQANLSLLSSLRILNLSDNQFEKE